MQYGPNDEILVRNPFHDPERPLDEIPEFWVTNPSYFVQLADAYNAGLKRLFARVDNTFLALMLAGF